VGPPSLLPDHMARRFSTRINAFLGTPGVPTSDGDDMFGLVYFHYLFFFHFLGFVGSAPVVEKVTSFTT